MLRLLLAAALSLLTATSAMAQTVYLVRHAEKADASADPVLSEAGEARAAALATALADVHPDHIFTSPLQRTRLTAGPTADFHSVPVEPVGFDGGTPAHVAAIAERVRGLPDDAVVLIVGHSNTVPLIARALGYAEAADMPDCEYDRMTMLHLMNGMAHSRVTRYGAPSTCG
ncbi:phosphoglycerate mutase [Brevundimonas denitrificans]|uniref:Phosphoglycerate mutase n=1 Tax=Brevundimonas denitrificans TaxID=1443434 RepID=A0ABQ6BFY5_9CAUL|nr:phosphoglycerate mutase family protein [Brevundimonas denitrificans]GLS00062.1 phosphoglycerate mutase [Brevundimonas denitrificans]